MKYVGVKTTGELRLHEAKEPQTDEIYMAVEDTKLGAVPIRPYEFAKWDGTKWVKVPDTQLLTTIDISVGSIPTGTDPDNPLMNAANTERMIAEMLPIDANTLRFEFSNKDYDPTVAGVGNSGTWKEFGSKYINVWEWTKSGTSFSSAFENAFADNDNLVSIIAAGDTSSITNMTRMFRYCTSLTSVPLFDTSSVTSMSAMFVNCTSLTSVPLLNTSSVSNISFMFYGCTSLTRVPLFNTSSVSNMDSMLGDCTKVESGALALYQQASTQATPPSSHVNTFKNCGISTETGAAELAQIPASWGGTAP